MKKKIISVLCLIAVLITSCISVSAYNWTYYSNGYAIQDNDNSVADVRDTIYYYLNENTDLNKAAICGIMGNIWAECCFNVNEVYGAYNGICQWGGGRWTNCQSYCSSHGYAYNSLEGQLGFLVYELKNSYSGTYKALLKVSNTEDGVYEAENIFRINFEGCGTQAKGRRQAAAITFWNNLPSVDSDNYVVPETTKAKTTKKTTTTKQTTTKKEVATTSKTVPTTTTTTLKSDVVSEDITIDINNTQNEKEQVEAVFAAITQVFEQVTMPSDSVLPIS